MLNTLTSSLQPSQPNIITLVIHIDLLDRRNHGNITYSWYTSNTAVCNL